MKFSELDYGDRFQVWDSKYDYVNGGTYMKICPATIINKTSGIYPPLPQEERIVAENQAKTQEINQNNC